MGASAHGNDLAGSVRYLAYCTGVCGLRPSFGRVPAYLRSAKEERPISMATMSVQGPLARHVANLRLALQAMSVGDARDPGWVPAPRAGPAPPRRVALTVNCQGVPADPAVVAAVRQAGASPSLARGAQVHVAGRRAGSATRACAAPSAGCWPSRRCWTTTRT